MRPPLSLLLPRRSSPGSLSRPSQPCFQALHSVLALPRMCQASPQPSCSPKLSTTVFAELEGLYIFDTPDSKQSLLLSNSFKPFAHTSTSPPPAGKPSCPRYPGAGWLQALREFSVTLRGPEVLPTTSVLLHSLQAPADPSTVLTSKSHV